MKRGARNRVGKAVIGSATLCYLCGLKIPDFIATPHHPLFGTVDHVHPRGYGGSNQLNNRRAAHCLCNTKKGGRLFCEIRPSEIAEWRGIVNGLLSKYGVKTSSRVKKSNMIKTEELHRSLLIYTALDTSKMTCETCGGTRLVCLTCQKPEKLCRCPDICASSGTLRGYDPIACDECDTPDLE